MYMLTIRYKERLRDFFSIDWQNLNHAYVMSVNFRMTFVNVQCKSNYSNTHTDYNGQNVKIFESR